MNYQDFYYSSQEGLRLYARDYGLRTSKKTPVICLPGLTRNSKDFDAIATHLSADRRVLCPDFRGRGKSEYAPSWTDYTPANEMRDTFDMMAAAGVDHAIFVGTSRGGLVTMAMGCNRPTAIKAVVMNDVGPEVDIAGITRIMGYVGKMSPPKSWDDAAITLRQMNDRHFPNLSGEKWHEFARMTFRDEDGVPASDYDPAIGLGLRRAAKLTRGKIPTMWNEFKSLSNIPLLLVRGENSDLLSKETVQKMNDAHANMTFVSAKDRGHAPFLDEPEVKSAIDAFLANTP
jgi:pimeloyl-ACP methyl ester carboxylesterase